MQEAAAVTTQDYYREYDYGPLTKHHVFEALCEAGADPLMARNAIAVMETNGILFRERKHK
jgi:hypothetical protein